MRRAILVFLLAVCVFGAAALGGFYAASRMAPERLRAEAEMRLSALLKAPVRLGEVRVILTEDLPWLQLEARGLRADPLPGGAALAIETVSGRIDPILLVLGRLELRGLRLSGIELALPEPRATAKRPGGEEPTDAASRAVAALTSAGVRLRAKPCPIPPIDGERLMVALTSAAAPPRPVLEVDAVSFRCGMLTSDGVWEASGRALLADRAVAPFALALAVSKDETVAKLTGESAPLGPLLEALRQPREVPLALDEALARFAPRAQSGGAVPPALAVDVLVATDLASEGLNLQDADVVVHYDLPWNPLRLAQRVGRSVRLGGMHDHVDVWWFAPPEPIERALGTLERIRRKAATQLSLPVPATSVVGRAQVVSEALERREEAARDAADPVHGHAVIRGAPGATAVIRWEANGGALREVLHVCGAGPVPDLTCHLSPETSSEAGAGG